MVIIQVNKVSAAWVALCQFQLETFSERSVYPLFDILDKGRTDKTTVFNRYECFFQAHKYLGQVPHREATPGDRRVKGAAV